jgi:hypothetical protein
MAIRPALTVLLLACVCAGAMTPRARAQALQQQSFARWKVMNNCAITATKQFPDHTPDSNAKREAARRECLRNNQIPVPAAAPAPQPH